MTGDSRLARRHGGLAASALIAGLFVCAVPSAGRAQSTTTTSPLSRDADRAGSSAKAGDAGSDAIADFPKISFQTLANLELAGFAASSGAGRGPGPSLRFDSTALVNVSDDLSLDGLFQFKPRQPLRADDPNNALFINQGAGRREGGKTKELYVRYGNFRAGKFVQNFGRAYLLLPGPYAADFVEETEQGYEPTEMIGGEWLHVFDDESAGWRQITLSAFMVDRTFLHRSFPYDEGVIHYKDGGVANTRFPTNVMATYDVLNQPIGNWAQLTWQASAIRFGRSRAAERGEVWATLNGDIAIPVHDSVAATLARDYAQVRIYVEGVRRQNFEGVGRSRARLSESVCRIPDRTVDPGWHDHASPHERSRDAIAARRVVHGNDRLPIADADHRLLEHRRRTRRRAARNLRRRAPHADVHELQSLPGPRRRVLKRTCAPVPTMPLGRTFPDPRAMR